jgi:uncharacterized membrane protein YphA (DoxX/SURF4 family)
MSQYQIGIFVLRLGLAGVYFYFGISQLLKPDDWVTMVPNWVLILSNLEPVTIVLVNGIFEIVFAALLLLGWWASWVSFLLAAHLLVITINLGFTPVGVRDFGLTMATIAHGLLEKKK